MAEAKGTSVEDQNLKSSKTMRLTEFINTTAEKVDIRNVYTASQLEEQTSFVENIVKDILKNVGEIESALVTYGLRNRGSYYDGTKILHPDEYDYQAVLGISQAITEVLLGESSINKEDYGDRSIRIDVNKLPHPLPAGCLKMMNQNGEAEIYTNKLHMLLHDTVVKALERMEKKATVRFGNKTHRKYENTCQYRLREISVGHLEDSRGSNVIRLRVGAPLGTTDIDLCFTLKWENPANTTDTSVCVMVSQYGPSNVTFWRKTFELEDKYKLTPSHKKLLLTLKYVNHLTTMLMSYTERSISSYILKTLILRHQTDCDADDNVGECFISIISALLKSSEEFDYDENFLYLTCNGRYSISDLIFPGKDMSGSMVAREPLLITMMWLAQHIKLNHNTDWWKIFLSNSFVEIRRNHVLQTLMDGLNALPNVMKSREQYRRLEWQHDATKSVVLIIWRFKEETQFLPSVN